jgi:hypothetical protein
MANGSPNAGLMDIPSQIDREDIAAEIVLEVPNSEVMMATEVDSDGIEITAEEDGSVVIDFDPQDQRGS